MKLKTKTAVTIEMTGAEAQQLAIWMHEKGAVHTDGVACDLLLALRELPEETS